MGIAAPALDVTAAERRTVLALLKRHLPNTTVWAYGSRVKWASRPESDLDLVAFARPEQGARLAELREAFDESDLPFSVDLFVWDEISEGFRKRIETEHTVLTGETPCAIDDWPAATLGDCIEINNSTYAPKDSWPFINYLDTGSVTENRIAGIQHLVVGKDEIPSRARRKVLPGDIVYSTVRPNQKHFGLLKSVPDNFLASTGFSVIRGKRGIACTDFIYWFLAQDRVVEHLQTIAEHSTSAYPSIKSTDIERLTINLPPLPEQRAIAHVLGTLDDRIELNRRMNATLETMARALFQSWFVDFDPVRAKMAGWDTGLPKDVADLFPDRLVDSECGEIPDGWPVESIDKHFEAVKGVSYKGSGLGTDGMPLHNLNSIREGGGYKYEGIKYYSGEYSDRHRVRPGDVIVANTEQGHNRLLIGHAAVVPEVFGPHGIASHHVYRVRARPNGRLSTAFLHLLLNSSIMHDAVSGYANGTTVNMLPIDALQRPPVVIPPKALVEALDAIALCAEKQREQIVRESGLLTSVRDTLLPKLISGEIRGGCMTGTLLTVPNQTSSCL